MTKKILFIFFILALTLVACTANDTTPAQEATVVVADTPSPIPQPTATATKVQLSGDGSLMACNVVSLLPPIDPTQAAVFPPVSDEDRTQGVEDARVTIVEYSDFQ